jgi:hypothetical protein
MKLERLIFKNDKGEFVDIPAREIESLHSELGKLLNGLAEKEVTLPSWPDSPSPSWPYPFRITCCEQQPLRFEWDGIEGDKVRLRATPQYRFTTSAPA